MHVSDLGRIWPSNAHVGTPSLRAYAKIRIGRNFPMQSTDGFCYRCTCRIVLLSILLLYTPRATSSCTGAASYLVQGSEFRPSVSTCRPRCFYTLLGPFGERPGARGSGYAQSYAQWQPKEQSQLLCLSRISMLFFPAAQDSISPEHLRAHEVRTWTARTVRASVGVWGKGAAPFVHTSRCYVRGAPSVKACWTRRDPLDFWVSSFAETHTEYPKSGLGM